MKKYLLLTTVLVLIFYISLLNSINIIENNNPENIKTQNQEFEQSNQIKVSIEWDDPIFIDGNNSFTPENGVSNGAGSRDDPYIIKDLNIQTDENESCIFINNTNAYFKIINCTLINSNPMPNNSTIKLNNVSNGHIFNNNITLAPVRLVNSNNNTISNNSIYESSYIRLEYAHNNTIFNNTISNNDISIYLSYSNNTKIIENDITNCSLGIATVESCENTIKANNIYNCEWPIRLWTGSNNNEVYLNYIYNYVFNIQEDSGCVGNDIYDNTYEQPGVPGPAPSPPPPAADDDDDDDNGGVEELFFIPIIISIIAAALVSTIAIITHRKLRKKKQKEIKKKLDKLPQVPKY
ncbi:MAG: NosD domain-containing protein [Promethearchaeota archaeon]